ncbi:hypothetical protein [Ruania halotolerans]|uniref:hypothetical protein n=1 Tax=Ruania halotolerans TaxID=2897773 RepID=UPI001E4C7406|nr:hypothetical protein [Ruania halotolerans]UFU07463.1 hypothetical protein LQF10_04995 [Ruania halotolerans]
MSVTQLLEEIERINGDDLDAAAEFGPLKLGPRGVVLEELVCADRRTRVVPSPQVREFYAYAAWWEHCSVQLEWCNQATIEELYAHSPVQDMLAADCAPGFLTTSGLSPSSIVLFAIDDRDAPFERAYFNVDGGGEPQVVYAGSEVSVFDDLAGYLQSWLDSLS